MDTLFEYPGKVAVVTGGGLGIGRALCRTLAAEGARVAVVDVDHPAAERVAAEIRGLVIAADVGSESAVATAVRTAEQALGPVDLYVSNAGVAFGDGPGGPALAAAENWDACLAVNLMAHVHAARHVVPGMLERGGGCFVCIASAAGLLCQVGDAAYSASKHAAVSFAESLSIAYASRGLRVSVVCPQAVATRMIGYDEDSVAEVHGFGGNDVDGILTAAEVATAIIEGVRHGQFLILPHPQVGTYVRRKANDHDRWIKGMQRFRRRLEDGGRE